MYLGKLILFGHNGCIWAKLVLFGENGCYWGKLALFGEIFFDLCNIGCICANWFYLGKLFLPGIIGCIWQNGYVCAKLVPPLSDFASWSFYVFAKITMRPFFLPFVLMPMHL